METILVAPSPQSMSPSAQINNSPPLKNDEVDLLCPSKLSCCLAMVFPCSWINCLQLDYRQEVVQMVWGEYRGTIREPGIYCANPCGVERHMLSTAVQSMVVPTTKVVDGRGNPLIIGGVVTYQVVDSRRAALEVVGWQGYLATQSEVVLKQICSLYPYEAKEGDDSLKREADKVRAEIIRLLQARVDIAGIQIKNFEFKELSYAPELV